MFDAQKINNQQLDYIDSFEEPAEFDFLTDDQRKSLEFESKKLQQSIQHFKARFGDSGWSDQVDKEILEGKIYSIQQALSIADKFRALNWFGDRKEIDRSLVTPTGQKVIMSRKCVAEALALDRDGYILNSNIDRLIEVLSQEGIDSDSMNKLKDSGSRYGLIILQNGIFVNLKSLLDAYLTRKTIETSPKIRIVEEPPQRAPIVLPTAPSPIHGQDLEVLRQRMMQNEGRGERVEGGVKMTLQEIRREVSTKELAVPRPALEIKPPRPVSSPPSPTRPVQQSRPEASNPILRIGTLSEIKTLDDLKKIGLVNLRQGALLVQLQTIKSKIVSLAAANRLLPYYAVNAFEQSPLFKSYLAHGKAGVEGMGEPVQMTKSEFEAMADLRKEIERL